MIEKPTKTATSTDSWRGTRQDCNRITNGASTKLKRTASATGTRTSRAKYKAVTISPATARLTSALPRGGCIFMMGTVSANEFNLAEAHRASVQSGRSRGEEGFQLVGDAKVPMN